MYTPCCDSSGDPPRSPDDVNERIREQVRNVGQMPYGYDGADALPIRPDVRDYILDTVCRPSNPWIKPTIIPRVRMHRNGTIEMDWVGVSRVMRLFVPCRHVLILEKQDRAHGGNTVVRIKLDQTALEDADEIRAAFRWVKGHEQ